MKLKDLISGGGVVEKQMLLDWDGEVDCESAPECVDLLVDGYDRIQPAMDASEYGRILLQVVRACETKCRSVTGPRYEAGRLLVEWALDIMHGNFLPEIRDDCLGILERSLESQYLESGESTRRFLVDSVLEHLFEDIFLRDRFESWKRNPVLGCAYEEAEAWASGVRVKRDFLLDVSNACVERSRRDGYTLCVEKAIPGVDTVAVVFEDGRFMGCRLVLDCSNALLESLQDDEESSLLSLSRLVDYALDDNNWSSSEYCREEFCVTLALR